MKKYVYAIIAAASLLTPFCGQAQLSGQISEFDFVPQRIYANPALRPTSGINIGIPALSNVYIEQGTNWFRPAEMLEMSGQNTVTINAENLLSQIGDQASTRSGTGIELLHVGVGFGKHYIHIRAAERAQFAAHLPRDIFAMAAYGNLGNNGFSNNTADFSGLELDGIHYREYAVGYNYQLNDKWAFGLTAKYLYGMEHIYTDASSLRLRTDPLTYDLESSGSFLMQTSGIYGAFAEDGEAIQNSSKYLAGLNNHGMGIDFGAVYKPIEKLELQFSGNDIGFINWNEDIANYGTTDASFLYNGIDLTEFLFDEDADFNNSFDDEVAETLDELEEVYNFDRTTESFRTPIGGYLRYGASFEVLKTHVSTGKVWANFHHGLPENSLPSRLAVGYHQTLWKVLQAGVHYSKQEGDAGFFGAGLAVNGGPIQFFGMIENIRFASMSRITIVDADSNEVRADLVYPNHAADIRLQVGFNVILGRATKDRGGRPMIR